MQQGRRFILPFVSLHSRVSVFSLLCSETTVLLQPVHPERVLCGRVGEHHVGVIEHMQSVQCEWVNLQLVQGKLGVRIEADVTDARQRVGQLFREAGWRLACDWERWQLRNTDSLIINQPFNYLHLDPLCVLLILFWIELHSWLNWRNYAFFLIQTQAIFNFEYSALFVYL